MSVVANVAINVDSRNAVSKLRQVQTQSQATSQAVGKLNATANSAAASIDAQGNAAQRAAGKLNGLRNALAGLGAGLALRKSFIDASELESAQSRIQLLGKNFQQLAGIENVAANAARKFNLSQSESLSALTDLGNRIGPTGASLEDVANVYEGFNTLLALNKVNSQNAASATLQLNQALGSGRLAGEEFNAISEATPQLLDAVAKVLGRNRGELKQLASDGKISSQVLIEALKRIRTEGAADLETAFGGAFGATRQFNAALENFSATVGTELLPALTPVINAATELLKQFGQLPGPIKTASVVIAGLAAAFVALAPAIGIIQGIIPAVKGLSLAMLAIPGIGWTAAAILGLGLLGKAVFDTNETFRNFVKNIGGVVASDFKTAVDGMADDARASANGIQKAYEDLSFKLSPIAKFIRELFQGAFKDTSNAAEASASASSSAFSTFFNGLISQGAAAFNGLGALITNWYNTLPAPIRSIFAGNALSTLAGAAVGAGSAASRAAKDKPERQGPYVPERLKKAPPKPTAVPNAMNTPVGAVVGGGGGAKGASDAKRAAEEMRRQLETADNLNFELKNRLAIAQLTEPVAKRMLEYDIRQNEIAKEYNELKKAAKGPSELALINANQIIEKRIAEVEYEREINELLAQRAILMANVMREAAMPTVYNELETQDAALKSILEKYPAIGAAADAAATLATSGIASMIAGTKSAQEVFVEFLDSIANALMQTAAKMIAQYIAIGIARMFAGLSSGPGNFAPSGPLAAVGDVGTGFNFDAGSMLNFGGFMAKGGPVSNGQTYMVGERGPELFVPGRSGTIVPNDKMGGGSTNVVVNVDAKGSSVAGDEQGANQLGRVISAAVQSELIKQQRPGGLLAR